MKDLFKIHYSFIVIILLLLFMGYINYVIIFFTILISHELGHIIMIKLLGFKIRRFTIYATGGVIDTDISINIESYKLFLISGAGIFMQLLLYLTPIKYIINYEIFNLLNSSLILFNLMPIYPLDGYKMLLSLIEYYSSYSRIIKISYIISFIAVIILFIETKSIIIFVFLYITNVKNVLNHRYYMEKFFIERYLYGIKYRKKKVVNDMYHIYKCRNNYIKCGNILKEEKEYYNEKYAYFIDI